MIGFGVCEVAGDDETNIISGEVTPFFNDVNSFRLANGLVGDPRFLSRLLWQRFPGFRVGEKVDKAWAFNGFGAEMDFFVWSSNGGRRVDKVVEGSDVEFELVAWSSSTAEMITNDW